jgi:hypothetical protein
LLGKTFEPGHGPAIARVAHEVIMSIANRIRVVGAIGTSIAVVIGLAVVFLVGSWFDFSRPLQTVLLAGAGMAGLLFITALCVILALAVDASQPHRAGEPELEFPGDERQTA